MHWFQCSCTFLRKGGEKKENRKKNQRRQTFSTHKAFSVNRIISALDIQFHLLSKREKSKSLHEQFCSPWVMAEIQFKKCTEVLCFYKAHFLFLQEKSLSSANFTFATATRTSRAAGRNILKAALTLCPQRVIKRR